MFHQGNLQSGITLAIQQSKSVACFVRDDDTESATWENEWLQEEQVAQVLTTKAVVLRLQGGSQEAGFLAAFCPINVLPIFVIIHNGQLRETLTSGTSHDEFRSRVCKALGEENIVHPPPRITPPSPATQPSVVTSSYPPTTTTSNPISASRSRHIVQAPQAQPSSNSSPVAPSSSTQPPSTTSPVVIAQELSTKAKGKQRAEQPSETSAPAKDDSRANWLAQQRQRQIQTRTEKDRILAQIELDKAERKARQAEEKRVRLNQAAEAELVSNIQPTRSIRPSNAKTANLQVRLLDGGTIRSQFSADATLTRDVRPWIDSKLESKAPYTFKHILPPQPARAISISEENSTLRDLGLLPSATLVLQSISNYTEAYSESPNGLLAMPYNVALGVYGLVAGTVEAVTGTLGGAARWLRGGTFTEQTVENHDARGRVLEQPVDEIGRQQQQGGSGGASARVRTLADQRAERESQEFYNGNSLDTQPKNDDEDRRR